MHIVHVLHRAASIGKSCNKHKNKSKNWKPKDLGLNISKSVSKSLKLYINQLESFRLLKEFRKTRHLVRGVGFEPTQAYASRFLKELPEDLSL